MLFDINWGFVFTIVNLLVLYLLLRKFLFGPVRNIMEQREKLISDQLTAAKEKERKAFALKEQYEATLAGAGTEAEAILEKARTRGEQEYDALLKDANENARQIMKQAKRDIETERERNMRELSSQIASLAVTAAGKAVGSRSGEFDEDLMNSFLKEEGALHD